LSGDGEFIVGGANGDDNKYEVYVWNTSTGALMDKLTGAGVSLYAVAWHPARTFLAVATSDGLVDMWGPRVNWTAFAPDFQALPSNVEYVEREDEFDVDTNGRFLADLDAKDQFDDDEASDVDVLTVARVPVFASDSEEESEVFTFPTRVRSGKWRVAKAATDD
jgi:COMPASS component SWD1